MIHYYNGKKYISTDELARKFTAAYGFKVSPYNINVLCHHYKVLHTTYRGINFFSSEGVTNMRERKPNFMEVLNNVVKYNNAYGPKKVEAPSFLPKIKSWDDIKVDDGMPEADMEKVSKMMIDKYQTEGRTVKINESQFKRLFEDVTWSKTDDGRVNLRIGQDKTDASNLGKNKVDTRMFGNPQDIKFGDGSQNDARSKSLFDTVRDKENAIDLYTDALTYVRNGRKGDVENNVFRGRPCNTKTRDAILRILQLPDEEAISELKHSIERITNGELPMFKGLYDRANVASQNDIDKMFRYTKFKIVGTNVDCIALFKMDNFDLSDALKKGGLRQTSASFGGDTSGYKVGSDGRIGVTYDNGQEYNLKQNFSLNGPINKDHFKTQYQLQGAKYDTNVNGADDLQRELSKNKKYTSVNQFLDKSVMYAANALKEERFYPDFIVTAPSSSDFNEYYTINLSNKIGVPYEKDFFKKDIVHARFANNVTEEELIEKGLAPMEIEKIKQAIKNYAYKEITYQIEAPLRKLVNDNIELFSNISVVRYARGEANKATPEQIVRELSKFCFKQLMPMVSSGNYIEKNIGGNLFRLMESERFQNNIGPSIVNIIRFKLGKGVLGDYINEMYKKIKGFSKEIENGYYPARYGVDSSKIVSIDKRYREYVEGSYIIADENFNEMGQLFERYARGKFLIVDEDVNSGGTFKLLIQAMKDKMPSGSESNLLCLANGYSKNGR